MLVFFFLPGRLPNQLRPVFLCRLVIAGSPRKRSWRAWPAETAAGYRLLPLYLKQKTPAKLLRFRCSSGRQDSNLRPPGPKPGALPACATSRMPNMGCKYNRFLPIFRLIFDGYRDRMLPKSHWSNSGLEGEIKQSGGERRSD